MPQLVDGLVVCLYLFDMKTIKVGAFEAKTHLSQLLDEVEKGSVVKISRRGKPVAILKKDDALSRENALQALKSLRGLCPHKIEVDELIRLRDQGRKR